MIETFVNVVNIICWWKKQVFVLFACLPGENRKLVASSQDSEQAAILNFAGFVKFSHVFELNI